VSDYQLNKALFALARTHRMAGEGLHVDAAHAAGLTDEELAALRDGDTVALYRLGANPYLIRRVFRNRFPM
jgi:hypothetical protein